MKTYRILTLLIVSAVAVSCHFLDFDESDGLYTHDDIYKYFDNTKQMLTNVYSYIPQDFGAVDGAMRDNASDDAECGNAGCDVQDFNNGNWSALNTHDTAWSLYDGIRAANGFIASIADVDFSRFEHSTGYENWEKQLRYFPYEARLLRAFYFFELARRYGDIAMPTRVLTIAEARLLSWMSSVSLWLSVTNVPLTEICRTHTPGSPATRPDVLHAALLLASNQRPCSMPQVRSTIRLWKRTDGRLLRRPPWI